MAGALVLGPVLFQGFEVPERINLGGRQRLALHNLPGGGRVVDAMGPEEAPIRWSGVFSGVGAPERVRSLDRLRRSGVMLPLSWNGWLYTVVIETFAAHPENPSWIPYEIEVCVLSDFNSSLAEAALSLPGLAEATALGAGPGLDGRIAAAGVALGSGSLSVVVAASGELARLATARAYVGNIS